MSIIPEDIIFIEINEPLPFDKTKLY